MMNRRMALFANLDVNEEARPKMQRLPSFASQRPAITYKSLFLRDTLM